MRRWASPCALSEKAPRPGWCPSSRLSGRRWTPISPPPPFLQRPTSRCSAPSAAARSHRATCRRRCSNCAAASACPRARRRTRCATPSRPTCWAPAPTFGPSRNCWATPACRPRSATPTSTPRDYSTPTPARIRGRRRFPSGLHRPPLNAHGSLTPGFGTGWVGVTGAGHILAGGAEGHGHAVFADHLGRLRADDVDAEDLVSLRVGEHLGEAFGLVVDLGPAVGAERELAGLVGPAGFLELLFGLADPGDFGSGVDHARHQGGVHVTRRSAEHTAGLQS